jgi:F0F1-type ATP synthase epsilon subunit
MQNREAVSAELERAIRAELKDSPLIVLNAGLADVQPPDVIVMAQEAAKEREIAITKAEAQRAVEMTEADTKLQVAKKQQEIDLVEAETQAKVNDVLARGVTPAFVTQRMIRVMEQMASSPNKVFVVPTEAMQNPAIMMSLYQNGFNHDGPQEHNNAKEE